MNMRNRIGKPLKVVGILIVITLVLSLLWSGTSGFGSSGILTGIALALVLWAMLYLRQMENVSEKAVSQRIKAEFPSKSQQQVFQIYQHLKVKEIEGLFLKILDDAHGDVDRVKKLASIAEGVGWKAFLENHW